MSINELYLKGAEFYAMSADLQLFSSNLNALGRSTDLTVGF